MASGFSLLRRIGRPYSDIYLLEWDASHHGRRVYPKVSGLAAWSEN
jgi:hypothetical protein